jgi:O-antigen/teichoic acid export membrane protein
LPARWAVGRDWIGRSILAVGRIFLSNQTTARRDASNRSPVRHNLLANLGGKGLSLLLSIVCVPVYIEVLGIAGYGVIGIWMTLETIANIIDLGLSPTITREMAACSTQPDGSQQARDLVHTLEVGYWSIGVLIGGLIISYASPIATNWLHTNHLSADDLRRAVILIGVLIFCRWPVTFYIGGLSGLERQVLLSAVTIAYSCLRSLGSVFVLLFVSPTIFAFFVFQIIVNVLQTLALTILLWRCLPTGRPGRVRPELVRRIWRFAGGNSAATLIWLIVTNIDKVIVTGMLPLEVFGCYTLGSRIAASLASVSQPIFAALFPALSRQVAVRNEEKLADLYHRSSQLMSVLILPIALTMVFFAWPLILAWTGEPLVADRTASITALLAAGAAFGSFMSIPYALQLAYGWTRLAVWSNLFALFASVPLFLILTRYFGAVGTAAASMVIGASGFVTNVIPMHRKVLTCECKRWLVEDLGIPLVACSIFGWLLSRCAIFTNTRIGAGLLLSLSLLLLSVVAVIAAPVVRRQVTQILRTLVSIVPAL